MKLAGFVHALKALHQGEDDGSWTYVFWLANGRKVEGYVEAGNFGALEAVALVMNDGEQPDNIFIDIESVVSVHVVRKP